MIRTGYRAEIFKSYYDISFLYNIINRPPYKYCE